MLPTLPMKISKSRWAQWWKELTHIHAQFVERQQRAPRLRNTWGHTWKHLVHCSQCCMVTMFSNAFYVHILRNHIKLKSYFSTFWCFRKDNCETPYNFKSLSFKSSQNLKTFAWEKSNNIYVCEKTSRMRRFELN